MDLKKLRVKELKKILEDWGEVCLNTVILFERGLFLSVNSGSQQFLIINGYASLGKAIHDSQFSENFRNARDALKNQSM